MKGDKMKKLLLVLLVVALAAFLLVGCNPVTPPVEGEGEGEVEGVTVAISDSATVGDYTYVSAGSHDITVTFTTPVAGLVSASISPCSGDYTKAFIAGGSSVVLFPDATRKIWTGSGTFTASASDCCASYVEVVSGECTDTVCIAFPVIVDGEPPYALIEVDVANCECDGCAINFSSTSTDPDCAESELCCGDDCSGLASWSINLYDAYPFDVCCDPTVCEEPIGTGSGIDCPIDFTTVCLTAGTYWAVISLVDNVGLEQNYYAKIVVSGGTANTSDCSIVVTEGFEAPAPYCITWATNPTATIGACIPMGPQPGDDKVTLTMAVNPSGGGTTSPAVGAHPGYTENQVVNITATPATGYHFVNWTGDVANLNNTSTTVIMNANKTVTANFEFTDVNEGPEEVDLGTSGDGFVILSEAGITDIPLSVITGNIGTWEMAGSAIGVTCAEVSGTIYDRDAAYTGGGGGSTVCRLTDDPLLNAAVLDMRAAYTAAANATPGVGPFLNLGGGTVAGQTLVPGVYTWGSDVTITSDLILSGGANDVWIFQITGTLDISSNMKVLLSGGAQAKNIFWQVADVVTLGTGSHFEGIILAKTKIAMQTDASINGRLWAQTEVTLDQNTVTQPQP